MEEKTSEKDDIKYREIDKKIDEYLKIAFDNFDKYIPVKEDDTLILLKAHLLAEYYINQLIILFYEADGYKKVEDDFSEKIKYIENIRNTKDKQILKGSEIKAIRRLNNTRNKLSHEIEYNISEADVDLMGFCFGSRYIHQKFKRKNLKISLLWVLQQIINVVLYTKVITKILMDEEIHSLEKKHKQNIDNTPDKENPQISIVK